jgi:hypothetical protein
LFVLEVIVSTSPVPQLAGPPGYEVPVSYCQLEVLTPEPAAPLKSSRKTWVQPYGGVGAEAFADGVAAVAAATARPIVPRTATSARLKGRRMRGVPEGSLMGGASRVRGVGARVPAGERPRLLRALSSGGCALNVLSVTPVVKR